jgi:phosphoglycerate kinase
MKLMEDFDLSGKRILIREDFNVPMHDGKITNTSRIDCAVSTLKQAMAQQAKVIVMSHLGRPKEGAFDPAYSLKPIADYLSVKLSWPVTLFTLDSPPELEPGGIALLENVRFLEGEDENSPELSKKLAALGDIFVMDAFAVAHRIQASTCGVAKYSSKRCAGPLLAKELQAINAILKDPVSPVVAIVGGSKISTKLTLLENLLKKVDTIIVGGGIANTFLAALDFPIGSSLFEKSLMPVAKSVYDQATKLGKKIWLPQDVVVAPSLEAVGVVKNINEVKPEDKIFDIGPHSQRELQHILQKAKTILWNGPVGVFEVPAFSKGTESLAKSIIQSKAYSVAGGGDTVAAVEQFKVEKGISYLSTGGGAFLEALEGKVLPAVAALK